MASVHSPVIQHHERLMVTARRSGYVVAIAVNIFMFWIFNNILAWGALPFLTQEFARVLWLLNLSIGMTILFNLTYLGYDPQWYRSLTQVALNGISMVGTIRLFQVFPFDFSTYEFPWQLVARGVLVLALVGLVVGTATELFRMIRPR